MSSSVQRGSSAAAVLFGALIALSGLIRLLADSPESAATAAWPGLIGTVLGVLGLSGIYAAHGGLLGRWSPLA